MNTGLRINSNRKLYFFFSFLRDSARINQINKTLERYRDVKGTTQFSLSRRDEKQDSRMNRNGERGYRNKGEQREIFRTRSTSRAHSRRPRAWSCTNWPKESHARDARHDNTRLTREPEGREFGRHRSERRFACHTRDCNRCRSSRTAGVRMRRTFWACRVISHNQPPAYPCRVTLHVNSCIRSLRICHASLVRNCPSLTKQ